MLDIHVSRAYCKIKFEKKTCSSNIRLNVTKIKSLKGMDANITRQRKFFLKVSFKINEKTILHTCVVRQDISTNALWRIIVRY